MKKTQAKKKTAQVDDLPSRKTPDAEWGFKELERYALDRLAGSKECEEQVLKLGRRSVEEFYEAGRALKLISDLLKPEGRWSEWQDEAGLSTTQVYRAVRLFEEVGGPEELDHFTSVTQALLYYGIEKPRKQQPPKPDDEGEADEADDDETDESVEDDEDDERDEDAEEDEGKENAPKPNAAIEVSVKAGRATIRLDAGLFGQVLKTEERKGVLVTGRWDRAAIRAAGAGIPVLVWSEINPEWRPDEEGGR